MPETGIAVDQAERAEEPGWDGITFTDSQNLVGDPFVAVALAAGRPRRLRFATGVTNAYTRHPAALATVAATVQEASGGRFVLGIGRGDTALFHLGLPADARRPLRRARSPTCRPTSPAAPSTATATPSRLQWLDRARQPKVPLDIAASGPADDRPRGPHRRARHVRRRRRSRPDGVGARPGPQGRGRRRAAIPARSRSAPTSTSAATPTSTRARALIAGGVAAFAHFSAMPGSTGAGLADGDRAVVAEVGRRYDSNQHLQQPAPPTPRRSTPTSSTASPSSARPTRCAERLRELGRPRRRAVRHHRRRASAPTATTPAPPAPLLTAELLPDPATSEAPP